MKWNSLTYNVLLRCIQTYSIFLLTKLSFDFWTSDLRISFSYRLLFRFIFILSLSYININCLGSINVKLYYIFKTSKSDNGQLSIDHIHNCIFLFKYQMSSRIEILHLSEKVILKKITCVTLSNKWNLHFFCFSSIARIQMEFYK